MANNINERVQEKISSVTLSDGNKWSFFDKEGVHYKYVDGRGFILITGDPVIDGEILNKSLHITAINDENIDNLLTYDRTTGQIKTRDINYIYKDIGGKENAVDNSGVLSIGTPEVHSPTN